MGRRSETPSAAEENDETPKTGRTPRAAAKRKSLKEVDEDSEAEVVRPSRKRKPVGEEKNSDEEQPDADAEESGDEGTSAKPSTSKRKRNSGRRVEPDDEEPEEDPEYNENEENEQPRAKSGRKKKKEPVENHEEQEYEVEKIVDDRAIKGRVQYKIRWKGYQSEDDTWENESTLDCNELIEEYNDAKGEEARANGSPAKTPKGRGRSAKSRDQQGRKQNATKSERGGKDRKYTHNPPGPDGEWEVLKLIDMHTLKTGKREFLVRWKGYPPEDDSWEPEEHLKGTEILEKFLKKVEQAREATEKELRVRRKPTDFYAPGPVSKKGLRNSKRFAYKERAKYYDAE